MLAALILAVGVFMQGGPLVPHTTAEPATSKDYLELGRALREVQATISSLETMLAGDSKWQNECRGYSPEKTVRCGAAKFNPPGGTSQAISIWQCESNFGIEPDHSDAYHGPFQYLYSTYAGQQESMPNVVDWYGLSPAVHDVRSNILTAVAWAARHGWGPWGCA